MSDQNYLRIEDAGGLIMAPDWAAIASLHKAINAAITSLPQVDTDARNEYDKYAYQSYNAVSQALRAALRAAGLAFTVNIAGVDTTTTQSKQGNPMNACTVALAITLADSATGAMKVITWYGEGSDRGERAKQKAITAGLKGWIRSQFLASTRGDIEPDAADESDQPHTQGQQPEDQSEPIEMPQNEQPHGAPTAWGDPEHAKRAFLAWCGNAAKAHKCQLTYEQIKQSLGVEHLHQYGGTYAQAQAAILATLKKAQPQPTDQPAK